MMGPVARKGDVVLEARDIEAIARAVGAEGAAGDWRQAAVDSAASAASAGVDGEGPSPLSASSSATSGGLGRSAREAETRVVLHARSASRADCLAACAADHSCQRFRLMRARSFPGV